MGLAHAHERGVVHRDIKPGNIMLTADGVIKILDLGLARMAEGCDTMTDGWIGTVDYSSPEQCDDARYVDHRSDIYSLACTLHYLIVGRPPFADVKGLKAKLLAHYGRSAPRLQAARPDVPEALEALFQRMMAKAPHDRPQSMKEVAAALVACRAPRRVDPEPRRESRPQFDPRPRSQSPPSPPPSQPLEVARPTRQVEAQAEPDPRPEPVESASDRSGRWVLSAAIAAIGAILIFLAG